MRSRLCTCGLVTGFVGDRFFDAMALKALSEPPPDGLCEVVRETETHLGLGGMNVYINVIGGNVDGQYNGRVAPLWHPSLFFDTKSASKVLQK